MALFETTRFALWLAFVFCEHVLQSREFAIVMVVLVFLSVFIFAVFFVWTIGSRRPETISKVFLVKTKTGGSERGSVGKRQLSHTNMTKSTEGDMSYYIEFDEQAPVPTSGRASTSRLQKIPEEPDFAGRNSSGQGQTNANFTSPMICETTAEIEPSGNSGDVRICLTLKSSDVQYQKTKPICADMNRSQPDGQPTRGQEYTVMTDDTRSGAMPVRERSMERSMSVPKLPVTAASDQSGKANCMTVGKKASAYLDLGHEYMPMGSTTYTEMGSVMGLNAYEN